MALANIKTRSSLSRFFFLFLLFFISSMIPQLPLYHIPKTAMSRTLNSTQASAACSRGLTRSHNPPIPPPTTSYTSATSPISSTLSTPSTPNRRPSPPTTPVRRPHPFRGRPYDEVAAGDTSDSSLMGYIPSPIDAPDFSPIRSPYSPCGSFPSTPSSAIPTRYFVSPVNDREGARERRRESRPSPLTSLLASRGIQRELTPSPQALCPECTKVKILLPARWCGHQVTRKCLLST